MPHDLLNAIENDPLKKIKLDGLIQAPDLVTKRRFNEAKRVIGKVLKRFKTTRWQGKHA